MEPSINALGILRIESRVPNKSTYSPRTKIYSKYVGYATTRLHRHESHAISSMDAFCVSTDVKDYR